jgi:hypothetical protein
METNAQKSAAPIRVAFREVEKVDAAEVVTKTIIKWGKDNLFGQTLVGYAQDNPVHGGIINQKVTYISSAGITVEGKGAEEARANALGAFTLDETVQPCVVDFEMFNGYAVLFKRVGGSWVSEHVPFETIRATPDRHTFEISDDWSQRQTAKINRKIFSIERPGVLLDENVNEVLMYNIIRPKQRKIEGSNKLTLGYYPVPTYAGAIVSIRAGIEQDYFGLCQSVNGFTSSALINFADGVPIADGKADKIAEEVKASATDRDKQAGLIVTFSNGQENAPTVLSLTGDDLADRYTSANVEIKNKILMSHSVGSPTLFGLNGTSIFGTKEEMETAFGLFSANYVKHRQDFLASSLSWGLSKVYGAAITVSFNLYSLSGLRGKASEVGTALNTMSPLVANKILDNLEASEVRALVALPPATNPASPAALRAFEASKFTDDKILDASILLAFKAVGVSRSDFEAPESSAVNLSDLDASEARAFAAFDLFEAKLTARQQLIAQLIADGKTFGEITKAININALALSVELIKLRAEGVLKGWKVDKSNIKIGFEILYSYEVKAGLGAEVLPTTRDFCRALIDLNKFYTRAEIDRISATFEIDVWRFRGGFYHNPKTGITTPSCRHEWRQNVVAKKAN